MLVKWYRNFAGFGYLKLYVCTHTFGQPSELNRTKPWEKIQNVFGIVRFCMVWEISMHIRENPSNHGEYILTHSQMDTSCG